MVTGIEMVLESNVTGSTTNTFTAKVINTGSAGTGNISLATKTYTNGITATALVPVSLTMNTTLASTYLAAGDYLVYTSDQGASGLTDPIKKVILTIKGR